MIPPRLPRLPPSSIPKNPPDSSYGKTHSVEGISENSVIIQDLANTYRNTSPIINTYRIINTPRNGKPHTNQLSQPYINKPKTNQRKQMASQLSPEEQKEIVRRVKITQMYVTYGYTVLVSIIGILYALSGNVFLLGVFILFMVPMLLTILGMIGMAAKNYLEQYELTKEFPEEIRNISPFEKSDRKEQPLLIPINALEITEAKEEVDKLYVQN